MKNEPFFCSHALEGIRPDTPVVSTDRDCTRLRAVRFASVPRAVPVQRLSVIMAIMGIQSKRFRLSLPLAAAACAPRFALAACDREGYARSAIPAFQRM